MQQIQASIYAFAAILGDGSVVTWGHEHYGGDSHAVQDQLKNVQHIQATSTAFAAILVDGSVVRWGNARHGGESSAVQGELKNVQQIQASIYAFAAILGDGSVVTWGDEHHGGDSHAVQDQLKNVQQIQANSHAFAATLSDESVITWGEKALRWRQQGSAGGMKKPLAALISRQVQAEWPHRSTAESPCKRRATYKFAKSIRHRPFPRNDAEAESP